MEDKPLILDGLDGYQFEELIAKIMKRKGYQNIINTPKSKDLGKDIIMEGSKGEMVLVECKHQKFVGRPIIQKLQGAINHEEMQNPKKIVKGMIVTSGIFSQEAIDYNRQIGHEIELIDGRKLKNLCNELKIVILNGKVQIITNKSFENISEKDSENLVFKAYKKIYGNKIYIPKVKADLKYIPACYVRYNLAFDTYTSVGCVDSYQDNGEIIIEGISGKELESDQQDFYFSGRFDTDTIKDKNSQIILPFEFTENDIEEHAINSIIEEHTHTVSYVGNNNVVYSKVCIPKVRDIDIKEFIPIYMPLWKNYVNIGKMNYKQEFYVKGNNQSYLIDELRRCKICESEQDSYEDMSICPECARIVCGDHVKIDYWDEETPICTLHAKPYKLFLQTKYFATNKNLGEYEEWWESINFFEKIYEDRIAFWLSIAGMFVIGMFLLSLIVKISNS